MISGEYFRLSETPAVAELSVPARPACLHMHHTGQGRLSAAKACIEGLPPPCPAASEELGREFCEQLDGLVGPQLTLLASDICEQYNINRRISGSDYGMSENAVNTVLNNFRFL